MENIFFEEDKLPYGTRLGEWKMEQVTAYRCNRCGKIYMKPWHHRLCPLNPETIHCRDCRNFIYDAVDAYGHKANRCKKGHLHGYPGTPRKSNCADVDIPEPFKGTWF